jgi:hypothetical protein
MTNRIWRFGSKSGLSSKVRIVRDNSSEAYGSFRHLKSQEFLAGRASSRSFSSRLSITNRQITIRDLSQVQTAESRCVPTMKIALAARSRSHAQEKKEQARQKRIDEVTAELEKIEAEERKIKTLRKEVIAWQRAKRIREYTVAVREEAGRKTDPHGRAKVSEWIEWAERQADRSDPMKSSPSSIVDDKEKVIRRLRSVEGIGGPNQFPMRTCEGLLSNWVGNIFSHCAELGSFCLVIHLADSVDQGIRFVKLDVLRAIVGEDLFRVRRLCEETRLGRRHLLFIFQVLRSVRGLLFQLADAVVAAGEHANGPRAI